MSSTEAVTIEVPDIGDFADVPIIEILVSPGDAVGADDPLLTLESDKATMDVPAPFAGVVRDLRVKVGDKVSQGTALLILEPAGDRPETGPKASAAASDGAPSEASAPAAVEGALQAEPPPTVSVEPPVVVSDGAGEIYASPSVSRMARERGIDLTQVRGTGRKGR